MTITSEAEILSLIRSRSLVAKADYFRRYHQLYGELGNQKLAFEQLESEFKAMYGINRFTKLNNFKSAMRDHLNNIRRHPIGKLMQ